MHRLQIARTIFVRFKVVAHFVCDHESSAMPSFDLSVPLDVVADAVAPIINDWIEMFTSGIPDGTEAFQCHIISEIARVMGSHMEGDCAP